MRTLCDAHDKSIHVITYLGILVAVSSSYLVYCCNQFVDALDTCYILQPCVALLLAGSSSLASVCAGSLTLMDAGK